MKYLKAYLVPVKDKHQSYLQNGETNILSTKPPQVFRLKLAPHQLPLRVVNTTRLEEELLVLSRLVLS